MASRTRRSTTPRRSDTSDPARSRERALRVLFQADLRGVAPTIVLQRLDADPEARSLLDERDDLTEEVPIIPLPPPAPGAFPSSEPEDPATPGAQTTPTAQATPTAQTMPTAGRSSGWTDTPARGAPAELDGFTRALVRGVEEHRAAVEAMITRYSRRWAIPRMPVVDRNILRLATYELLHEPTPPAVAIDEAVGLAKRLSTDDSGRFVNGVLESIRKEIADTRMRTADPES